MRKNLLYLIGPPGAGKSTLALALFTGSGDAAAKTAPLAHLVYPSGVVSLGKAHATFPGTDTLPMNVQPLAEAFVASPDAPAFLFGEGDRLANDKFFEAAALAGYRLNIFSLIVPPAVGAARRAERAERNGAKLQDALWVRGRETKATNLTNRGCMPSRLLDATRPVADLVAAFADDPVVQRLRNGANE